MAATTEYFLDITTEVCPMTFVKTRLLIENMSSGDTADIRLVGEEPLQNVPASITELGHIVLSLEPEENQNDAGLANVHRLRIKKT